MNRYNNMSKENLVERAKELECLYLIDEALLKSSLSEILTEIIGIISLGFRNIKACNAVIILNDQVYSTKPVTENGDELQAEIIINKEVQGFVRVIYPKNTFPSGEAIFLEQEHRLLKTIANRISECIEKKDLKVNYSRKSWETIIHLLQKTDEDMLLYVCEKMLSLLARTNPNVLSEIFREMDWVKYEIQGEINFPLETLPAVDVQRLSNIIFSLVSTCLQNSQIYEYVSLWVYQGKTYELIKIVDKKDSDVKKIITALRQYNKAVDGNVMSSEATKRWLIVELTRRFLTDNLKIISSVQKYISINGFCELLDSFICSPRSIGKIGGKGTGFFISNQIIKSYIEQNPEFENIRIPKTWYISSDELSYLIEDNKLDELNEHKYRDIIDTRTGYPRIIQMMKNAKLSPYILNELSRIIDYCQDKPLIIRSSSLLEDQIDSSFAGKYKSLFITNTGTKDERQKQLVDGILEVYASLFNPDSIQYRKERGLLDCCEQMGIMIQEVVGSKVGPYFFPLYAGVAFSHNELRWSPRIRREDGLLRMVMGLGTRAVDRVGEDFPILISPGQPNLRVNQSLFELTKYSPQMIDAIDLVNNKFVTLSIKDVIKDYGNEIPHIGYVASTIKNDFVSELNRFTTNFKTDDIIITFNGLVNKTPIVKQVHSILNLLKEQLGYPVDIEFASDGDYFYLLQCRPQSKNHDNAPVPIPADIPYQHTIFTANRYISNGKVSGIKTIVYVDPDEYKKLKYEDIYNVRNAISELNQILPRRSFILMGPGRWGSRGDIKLGVPIAYSDINNTAMLIEISQKESKYQPELSFGTHFFQDLVEENIKYLPLYPEDKDIIFHYSFFRSCKNSLQEMLPTFSILSDVIKVIQIDKHYYNKEMTVLMNADLEKAIAYVKKPKKHETNDDLNKMKIDKEIKEDQGWQWRHYMAEEIAKQMDMEAYHVKGIYLFGSTNNCTARLNSDIDLIIHFEGNEDQKKQLMTWLDGWSMALSKMNFLNTGYKSDGLLDIHFINDKDIEDKKSYASKINSVYDPAFPLRLRN